MITTKDTYETIGGLTASTVYSITSISITNKENTPNINTVAINNYINDFSWVTKEYGELTTNNKKVNVINSVFGNYISKETKDKDNSNENSSSDNNNDNENEI